VRTAVLRRCFGRLISTARLVRINGCRTRRGGRARLRSNGSFKQIREVTARAAHATRDAWDTSARIGGASARLALACARLRGAPEQARGPSLSAARASAQLRRVTLSSTGARFLPRGRDQRVRGPSRQPRRQEKQARGAKIRREFSKIVRQGLALLLQKTKNLRAG